MDERIEKWLFDIRLAIDEFNSYFKDGEKKRQQQDANEK